MTAPGPSTPHRAGRIAIVGRPNVGKSTLLNRLIGQSLAIVSRRPQTTRTSLLGVLTRADAQFCFVDTPGLQDPRTANRSRAYNREAVQALEAVDVVLWLVEADRFGPGDEAVGRLLPEDLPVVLVISKIDLLRNREALLPFIDRVRQVRAFAAIVPISAERDRSLEPLLAVVAGLLPEQEPLYDPDTLTDRNERYFAGELLREKLFRQLGEELPYACEVSIDQFEQEGRLRRIHASVLVEKSGQKAIVIGEKGARLKAIARAARLDMEKLFDGPVFLDVWVKVQRTRRREMLPGADPEG
jgi:GTP-binding protein Era